MKPVFSGAALACAIFLGSSGAAAQNGPPTVVDYLGPFLDLGVSVRTQTFRVFSPDGPYGEFASTRVLPALTIGSPMWTFKQGKYGVNLVWSATALSMHRQTPPDGRWYLGDAEDVGTSIDGYIWHLTPNLNLLGEHPPGSFLDASRFGIGVGLGHIKADGDILLNRAEEGSDETVESPELRTVDVDRYSPSFTMFFEGRRGPFTTALSIGGPFVLGSYETDVLEFAVSISYSWYRSRRAPAAPSP